MLEDLAAEAAALADRAPARAFLGLAGAPGAGKSALARYLVDAARAKLGPPGAAYLPMDGFHLSNLQLDRLGLRDRKGAPDTFDVRGYLALLRRLHAAADAPVYAPDFDRAADEPIAARLVVEPGVRLIVTEGNYLADDAPLWREVRALLTDLWYVEADDETREARLVERQRAGGRSFEDARAWVRRSDRANGEIAKAARGNCSRIVRVGDAERLRRCD
ncbi:nucleoside/nucleotide kinase family protein [Streptomonospora wellingtoniae]|uniref:Nucleoside/nucleotide kinase family protein n=1 Tax=Streptomonospora wellingtoniae TaxID=3075544 RepID=A0ABU2KRI9_9ACTN|nr:nucleoside/nucleotide kinase family protein [Streptomonospora sp. DSM 45055]MDT0301889.1 nucleoside/nucleotide kinase family protein [Streptomonospora sp. DSM 45055]